MTSPLNFESRRDSRQQFTTLTIDPASASIQSLKLFQAGAAQPLWTLDALPLSLFTLRLFKYDLATGKYELVGGNPLFIEYRVAPGARCDVQQTADMLTLTYAQVPASLPGYGPINVTLTFSAPADPPGHQGESLNAGWIELDIHHTYPAQPAFDPAKTAWETEIIYPEINFAAPALADYLLLDPNGRLGNFIQQALKNSPAGVPPRDSYYLMPMQFAALYKHGRTGAGVNFVNGLALSGDDQLGHAKRLRYRPFNSNLATPPESYALSFSLLAPMHLKNKAYRRPAAYALSGGATDGGFSGAQMRYRLRAFQIHGAARDVPVDWYDVADIYRRWVKRRKPSFYRKHIQRAPNGFVDTMCPFTVVSNYGLDGQIDPAARDAQYPQMNKWLELHPIIIDGLADMPGNNPNQADKNESLQDFLVRLKARFNVPQMKFEAQIWGFEKLGFYRFLGGFPPATNLLSGKPRKFQRMADELLAKGIHVSITTDPLNTNFERRRFRGHLLKDGTGWRNAILLPFPKALQREYQDGQVNCAHASQPGNNRVALPTAACPQLLPARKRAGDGTLSGRTEGLTRFYNITGWRLCPIQTVENIYLNQWLRDGLFSFGAKLLEFMKHHYGFYFCYDKNHQHVVPPDPGLPYDNVIGWGPWYVARVAKILARTQNLGQQRVGADFALTNEFTFPEQLLPYFDELYEYDGSSINVYYGAGTRSWPLLEDKGDARNVPVFHFVYSDMVSMKMNLADAAPNIHPGYKEAPKNTPPAPPAYMLAPTLDDEACPPISFDTWSHESTTYAADNYRVVSHGLAPKDYPTYSGKEQNGTYTYNHCAQSVFNLRSHIFRYGLAGVLGERIYLFSTLYEEPKEYNEEAVRVAVRAAHMQMRFNRFFRVGWMLGQTRIISGNHSVWAWRAHKRQFNDVAPLVNATYNEEEIDGSAPVRLDLSDAISRATDKEKPTPLGKYNYEPHEKLPQAVRIGLDRIPHMIWQRPMEQGGFRTLYLFANVGNSPRQIEFLYSRGLEDGQTWKRIVHTFAGDPNGAPGAPGDVRLNATEIVTIPTRAFVAVLLYK